LRKDPWRKSKKKNADNLWTPCENKEVAAYEHKLLPNNLTGAY
jgi:hypothetical protein